MGIFHALRGGAESSEQLASLVGKTFLNGKLPARSPFEGSRAEIADYFIKWARTGRGGAKLLEDPKGSFKYIGVDYLMYGETQFFWPPPLVDLYSRNEAVDVSTASSLWVGRGIWCAEHMEDLLAALQSYFGGKSAIGAFQLCE